MFPSPKFQFTWELPTAVPLKLILAFPFINGKLPELGVKFNVTLLVLLMIFVLTGALPQAEAYSMTHL